jgi:hypothetical protein
MEQQMAHVFEGIDLDFRPRSYFWPIDAETHLLSRIKGAGRRAALRRLVDQGQLGRAPALLADSALSPADRHSLGAIHPAWMGGEYLPDLAPEEVMIARIVIASTTQDVTCVYARRGHQQIHYRVVDEYGGDTLTGPSEYTSDRPLPLGHLESFFNEAWPLFEVLESNFGNDVYDVEQMLDFVVSVDSEFYPDIDRLYRARIRAWAAEQTSDAHAGRGEGRL